MLAAAYHERTGDIAFIKRIWRSIERSLEWIDRYGDLDGDGFVEYARCHPKGLVNQGWKDSHDAVFHADGTLATPPIALCEIQAYVYAAFQGARRSRLRSVGRRRAADLAAKAERLAARSTRHSGTRIIGMYVLALDGAKRPCLVRASNAGHALLAGIAPRPRARGSLAR